MDYGLKYIKSKIIKLKLLDENIDEIFIALGKDFLHMYQKHYPQKKKNDNSHQISSKCKASIQDTLKRIKRKATD